MNRSELRTFRCSWQEEYFAASVRQSHPEKVRRHIDRQEEHYRIKSFAEEYEEFIEPYGFIGSANGTVMEKL